MEFKMKIHEENAKYLNRFYRILITYKKNPQTISIYENDLFFISRIHLQNISLSGPIQINYFVFFSFFVRLKKIFITEYLFTRQLFDDDLLFLLINLFLINSIFESIDRCNIKNIKLNHPIMSEYFKEKLCNL